MQLTGQLLIQGEFQPGTGAISQAMDPSRDLPLTPDYADASTQQVDQACQAAAAAQVGWRNTPAHQRAAVLEAIGEAIMALGDTLIERAVAETALPRARIEGERGRTVGQLQLFAQVLREGRWCNAIVEPALPGRTPLPRPDLRQQQIALGPVAVFGASNFPLAFSVAGGDSASALAAGCPVVVKAHPAHPGTSELVGYAISQALRRCGCAPGIFALLYGADHHVSQALVSHPAIAAVGFTGSRAGGLALSRLAQQRPRPVPVYAEMSSINPLFILPGTQSRLAQIADGFIASLMLGSGQFCTNPGLVLVLGEAQTDAFCAEVSRALAAKPASTMLTAGLCRNWQQADSALAALPGVTSVASGQSAQGASQAQGRVYRTRAAHFLAQPAMQQEVFGPSSLVVCCAGEDELQQVASQLEGQLTVTLQMAPSDLALAQRLLPQLEQLAGRILVNGFPTGVDVGYAMVHGGPFPATSDGRTTSVGAEAISRFLRPICYQDFPAELLPEALRDEATSPQRRY